MRAVSRVHCTNIACNVWCDKGIVLRQGHLAHGELNVKGSSIAPPSDSGADMVVSARNTAVDLHRDTHFDDGPLNWGWSSVCLSVCLVTCRYCLSVCPLPGSLVFVVQADVYA